MISDKRVLKNQKEAKIQGGSQKSLLATKESIVSSSIFCGPPCMFTCNNTTPTSVTVYLNFDTKSIDIFRNFYLQV